MYEDLCVCEYLCVFLCVSAFVCDRLCCVRSRVCV